MKYRILYIIPFLLLVASCAKDEGDGGTTPQGSYLPVTLTMTLPEPADGTTRSLSSTKERTVDELRVFMFDTSGKYVHDAMGDNITQGYLDVSCRILMYAGTYDFVVVANSSDFIDASFPGGIPDGMTYAQFSEQLTAECSAIWNADSSDPDYLPMWGIAKNKTISLADAKVDGIDLLRALARINVVVENTVAGTYELQSVSVYRNYRRGRVIPEAAKWNGATVTAPSLPTGGTLLNTAGHTVNSITINHSVLNEIYVFETPAGADLSGGGADDNFCLVLGMLYDGTPNYYRIDFTGTSGYIPVLRNHTYLVTVKGIDRAGAGTMQEALAGRPANIQYEITDTNKSGMNHIAWDGQHYLMLGSDSLYFWNSSSEITLPVQTNYTGGWKVINNLSWVSASPLSSTNTTEGVITLTATADPSLTAEREGKFTVTAGELTLEVIVVQSHLTELRIDADPDYMIFYSSGNDPVTISVDRAPAATPYKVELLGDITWTTSPSSPATSSTLTFLPQNNTSGNILSGIIRLTIQSTDGRTEMKDITVRQYPGTNPFVVAADIYYPAPAHQGKFWLSSTAAWYLRRSVPIGAASLPGTFAAGSTAEYSFSLTANNTYESREVTLVFSTTDDTMEHEMVITQEGNTPTLLFNTTLTNNIDIEFTSNGPGYHDVIFEYNFAWMMEAGSGLNNIVSSMSRNTGTIYPCAQIAAGQSETLKINAYDYTGQTNVPEAGTVLTSSIKFFNYATDPYPTTDMGTINIKRTILPVIDIISVTSSAGTGMFPQTGGTLSVRAGANAAWSISTSDGQTVSAPSGNYSVNTLAITIPPNNDFGSQKEIELFYTFNGQTLSLGTYRQELYNVVFENRQVDGKWVSLYGYGDTYPATLSGFYPDLYVKLVDENDGTDASDIYTINGARSQQEFEMEVYPNLSGITRRVRIYYSADNTTWFSTSIFRTQYRDGFYTTRGIIALANAGSPVTWAEAMGIDTYYNNWTFYNRYQNQDRENPNYTVTESTGCGAYSETSHASGWRLPTSTELKLILKAQIEGEYDFGITEGERFHTAYDAGLTVNRIVWIEGGAIMESEKVENKSEQALVRCIRQL